jgi:hypothetical protein
MSRGYFIATREGLWVDIQIAMPILARPALHCLGGPGSGRAGGSVLHILVDDAGCPAWIQVPPPPGFRAYLPMVVQAGGRLKILHHNSRGL